MGDRSNRNWFGPTQGGAVLTSKYGVVLWSTGDLGPTPPKSAGGAARISAEGVANAITLFPFVLLATITIQRYTFNVNLGNAGDTANFGIYDLSGNLLIDSGAISCATTGSNPTGVAAAPITISPGIYFFAQSCTSSTPTCIAISFATPTQGVDNANFRRIFITCVNKTIAGVMPSTTGAISPGATSNPIGVGAWEP